MADTIAQQLVDYLERRGVRYVFGLCGHTNIAVLSAMVGSSVQFVNVRHEQIAAHAADGYARVTGRASVLLTHLGPGLTNAATGVANAALDCTPMVVIAGDVPSHYFGKHPHQEVNLHSDGAQYEIYRPFVKRAWRVTDPKLFPETLEKAFALAESGQPGPVLLDVPMDVFSATVDPQLFARLGGNTSALKPPSLSADSAREIVKLLYAARHPVIYAGGGVLLARASEELKGLVEHLGIPVAHSLMGKGALADDHPLVLGMTGFWGTSLVNETCLEADWVLGLGTRFKEADCSSWYRDYTFNIPPTQLIHIDIEPMEIGRNFPTRLGFVADLKEALSALVQTARELFPKGRQNQAIIDRIAEFRREFARRNREMQTSDAFPMMPERILAEVRRAAPRDVIITTDVGWNKNGVGQQFPVLTPGTVLTPGGFATMGFGPPAALGAKLAAPERTVISLVGDGGFGQNPATLATAVEQNLPVIWLVMNNNAYGTIAGLQQAAYGVTHGTVFPTCSDPAAQRPNYAEIARAYGCEGERLQAAGELAGALRRALDSGKPYVIDVPMKNNPTPTTGHWNILDIYSPEKSIRHAATT